MITEAYREQNRELHETNEAYGTSGMKYAKMVLDLATDLGTNTLLDYGCGKQTLANSLPQLIVHGYDPAIPGLDTPPEPHDLVVCTDVMEHVEPEYTDMVLDDLQRLTRRVLFLQVSTRPAIKVLPDGRNAHLVVQNRNWWLEKILQRFYLDKFSHHATPGPDGENYFIAMLSAKP